MSYDDFCVFGEFKQNDTIFPILRTFFASPVKFSESELYDSCKLSQRYADYSMTVLWNSGSVSA